MCLEVSRRFIDITCMRSVCGGNSEGLAPVMTHLQVDLGKLYQGRKKKQEEY